ncbi:mfs multidrug transporter [Diplodia corticola]|uniref:Mfs multidrug transporter n=1 Tax=Diplodia corticola TaxID=236234 RepID=A0A1J9RDM1_9PEZI|nr:mfs multidrug transporter [Diplodia corticola]OJD38640.1 mfs multidrug transporter [Diplodia corticola]
MSQREQRWWEDVSSYRSFAHADPASPTSDLEIAQLPNRDVEEGRTSRDALTPVRNDGEKDDPNIITWEDEQDPMNPLNWTKRKKWTATLLVSCFTFISPFSSTMIAPSLEVIGDQFDIESEVEQAFVMSIFLLAFALGPFVLGPLSEIFGRVVILQTSNLLFLVFNTACGFAQTKQQMLAFRFLSGLGGSAPQALGGGVLSDCWRAEERGKAVAMYSLAPFIGPAVGPIVGGLVTEHTTWRWVFWSVSIADFIIQIMATAWLRETYAPAILAKKVDKLRKSTGDQSLRTKWQNPDHSLAKILRTNLVRPFIMLGTQPVIQIMALYRAYLYGVMYLVLSTFALVFEDQYDMSLTMSSLNYLSLGIGFVIGLQICAPLNDRIYIYLKRKHNVSTGVPEYRIPLILPSTILTPVGLALYGWAASTDPAVHFLVPNVGAAIFACGLIMAFQCAQAYVVDAYTTYAASATGAAAFLRTMAGFSFPLFAPRLYDGLGLGVGNGVLAGVSAVVGVAVGWGFWKRGAWLRARSGYCAG